MSEINKNICFAFVCEPGELEIKSVLLVWSLRKKTGNETSIAVLIPAHRKNNISPVTLQKFENFRVTIIVFENLLTKNKNKLLPGEPMSNKFYGLKKLNFTGTIVFLDSDILCLNSFPNALLSFELSVKPADYSLTANWEEIYKIANLLFSKKKVKCTVDNVECPPYYNTGVIVINSKSKDILYKLWEEFFKLFSSEEIKNRKLFNPYHCDQLAFALAMEKHKFEINLLGETLNFPARKRSIITGEVVFAHYHDCYTIAKYEKLKKLFFSFLSENPEVMQILPKQSAWILLAKRKFTLIKIFERAGIIIKKFKRKIYSGR